MDIKLEILAKHLSDEVRSAVMDIDFDEKKVINSIAVNILKEIKGVLLNEKIKYDYEVVDEIVEIFGKYKIDVGGRHDF